MSKNDDYAHWRNMAADTVHHFWFTNREAGVLLADLDQLCAERETLRAACATLAQELREKAWTWRHLGIEKSVAGWADRLQGISEGKSV